jgi:nicotinamide riboside kinase
MSEQKIAFVGTSCIGKTSLLEATKRTLPKGQGLFVPEAARDYFGRNSDMPLEQRFAVIAQGEVQSLAWRREREAHRRAKRLGGLATIVCDRSVLDAPVYVSSQGDNQGAQQLLRRVRAWLPTYDQIYLLDPADVPFQQDTIRAEDSEARDKFHEAFINFFRKHRIAFQLLSGTPGQRLQIVMNDLEQMRGNDA